MSEEKEIWKVWRNTIRSLWEVSTFGHIRRNGNEYQPKDGRYLKFGGWLVHRAVAELFIPNPENLPCIDHKDRDKHNNHVSNLRWCTHKENSQNIDWEAVSKNMSKSRTGRQLSDEVKHKISMSLKGERNPMYGKHLSNETKKKLSESLKGRPSPNKGKHYRKRKIDKANFSLLNN